MEHAVNTICFYLYCLTGILTFIFVVVFLSGRSPVSFRTPFGKHDVTYRPERAAHGILLGRRSGLIAFSAEPDEGHIIVLGPSGTGKTSALLIPTLRSWQGTALVVDISGDISNNVHTPNKIVYAPAAADTIAYNVFAAVDSAETISDKNERLEQLAFLLMPDSPNASEASAFFTREGRKILTAAFICYYHEGWGFVQICEFILSHDWRSLLNDIAEHKNEIANMNISSFAGANDQNNAGCKQSADAAIKLFATNGRIKNALRKAENGENCISPDTLETNSLYIYIEDSKLKLYSPLLRIITAQCMEYFSERPKGNKNMILFCLDEFASFGKLDIVEALRKLRKKHIRIMVLTQSLADLDLVYGKDERIAMLGNFKLKILLGCGDMETQEYFSKMIGDEKYFFARGDDEKDHPIIKPADLAHLGQDLYVLSDDGAVRLRKNYYFKKSTISFITGKQ